MDFSFNASGRSDDYGADHPLGGVYWAPTAVLGFSFSLFRAWRCYFPIYTREFIPPLF